MNMAAETEFTIDELARAADITVRSVRVYHERGLLPSPDVRGRVGYYRGDHLDRLQTISRLLGRGMKLAGIRELLDAWDRGDGLADVLGVGPEEPLVTDAQSLELASTLSGSGLLTQDTLELVEQLRTDCAQLAERCATELRERMAGRDPADVDAARRAVGRAAAEMLEHAFTDPAPQTT